MNRLVVVLDVTIVSWFFSRSPNGLLLISLAYCNSKSKSLSIIVLICSLNSVRVLACWLLYKQIYIHTIVV